MIKGKENGAPGNAMEDWERLHSVCPPLAEGRNTRECVDFFRKFCRRLSYLICLMYTKNRKRNDGRVIATEKIKVMIIDDEPLAIEYLKNIIPWEANGYRIVAEATDAKRALQCFEKMHPQIVISDICMPGMSGLELCGGILHIDRFAKIILLTAYSEFEYAQKAVTIGASGYILKHEISAETILDELNRIRDLLDKERNTKNIVKKYVLLNCMEQYGGDNDGRNNEWGDLESAEKMFIMLLLKQDMPYPLFETENTEPVNIPNMEECLKELYSNLPEGFSFIDSFVTRSLLQIILFSYDGLLPQECLMKRLDAVIARTKEAFEKASERTFSVAAQAGKQKVENITYMYREGTRAFDAFPLTGRSRTLNLNDQPKPSSRIQKAFAFDKMKQVLRELSDSLEKQDMQKAMRTLDAIFLQFLAPVPEADLLRLCCNEIIYQIDKARADNFLSNLHEDEQLYAEAKSCYTLQNMDAVFKDFVRATFRDMADKKLIGYSKNVKMAIEFLYGHYEKDLSVTDVAQAVGVSESNLSRLFRAETGKTVIEYLKAIRINVSKRLLKSSNYKIYEIAEMVGYKTSQYFSQVFVKAVGINPIDYREKRPE